MRPASDPGRRTLLRASAGLLVLGAAGAAVRAVATDGGNAGAGERAAAAEAAIADAVRSELCASPAGFDAPLHVPSERGLLGLVRPDRPFTLRATPATLPVSGRPVPGLAFVADIGGRELLDPTLRLARGQSVQVDFENGLAEPTVVHWHGLAMDTANDGAGLVDVAPGGRKRYRFDVRDRAALHWYHPHPHGHTAGQVARGMLGLLWVDDDEEAALRKALGVEPGVTELPLVLTDATEPPLAYGDAPRPRLAGSYGWGTLVNFTARPVLEVDRRAHRFRVLNATNARNFLLAVCGPDGRPMPMRLLGVDGGRLAAPVECRQLFVSPAERVDLLVDLSMLDRGASAMLWSLPFDPMLAFDEPATATSDGASAAAGGAAATPAGDGVNAPSGVSAGHRGADTGADRHSRHAAIPDGTAQPLLRLLARGAGSVRATSPGTLGSFPAAGFQGAPSRSFRLGFAKARWRINDRVYAPDEAQVEVARGTKEVWLLRNYHTSMPHAMHLHGFHFRVLERQTSPDPVAALAGPHGLLSTDLGWKDTVLLWPGESVRIGIDFSHPFEGPQTYLVHCHNLEHEDQGMMLNVRVA